MIRPAAAAIVAIPLMFQVSPTIADDSEIANALNTIVNLYENNGAKAQVVSGYVCPFVSLKQLWSLQARKKIDSYGVTEDDAEPDGPSLFFSRGIDIFWTVVIRVHFDGSGTCSATVFPTKWVAQDSLGLRVGRAIPGKASDELAFRQHQDEMAVLRLGID